VPAKKEKKYAPGALVSTTEHAKRDAAAKQQQNLQNYQEYQLQKQLRQQQRQQQAGAGGGGAGGAGGLVGQTVGGVTSGVGNIAGQAVGGVGRTLGDTTGALGRGDVLGGVGGLTGGVGRTVGGVGKGLVSLFPIFCSGVRRLWLCALPLFPGVFMLQLQLLLLLQHKERCSLCRGRGYLTFGGV